MIKSEAVLQYDLSQEAFLKHNQEELAAQVDQANELSSRIDRTIASVRQTLSDLDSLEPQNTTVGKEASRFAVVMKDLTAAIDALQAATQSQKFAKPLVQIVGKLVASDRSFPFQVDSGVLLIVLQEISP